MDRLLAYVLKVFFKNEKFLEKIIFFWHLNLYSESLIKLSKEKIPKLYFIMKNYIKKLILLIINTTLE
jgi:hypothetical protein